MTGRWRKLLMVGIGVAVLAAWISTRSGRRMVGALPSPNDEAPQPVDQAIDESFPASGPPSWAGQS